MSDEILIASPNLSLDRTIEVALFAPGHVHRSIASDVRGGGKGANVARALASVGSCATVVGLSAGRTGEAVEGLLADEGIDTVAVRCPGETRSCLTVLAQQEVTVFNESGPCIDEGAWEAFESEVRSRLGAARLFVCSGSFPPGAPDDGAARLVAAARGRGLPTICDVSREQLDNALSAQPDIVTPNLAEAVSVLEGGDEEPVDPGANALQRAIDAAGALLERGARAVVVTAGATGAVARTHAVSEVVPAVPIAVRNPVGAGDCLVAGLALGLAGGQDVVAATRRGVAMAAAGCETFAAGVVDGARYRALLRETVKR